MPRASFLDRWFPPIPATYITIVWNLLQAILSAYNSYAIADQRDFFNLGRPVQYFIALIVFIPALVALYSIYHLVLRHSQGRIAAIGLNYLGMVFSLVYLVHLWGFFVGMDSMAGAIYENRVWGLGLLLAYGIYWLSGRLPEDSTPQQWLDRIGLGLGMLSLIGLLWFGGILGALGDVLSTYGEARTWIVTIAGLVFALVTYRMLTLGKYFGETPDQRIAWQGWLFLSPNIIGFTIFFAGPLLFSLYLSFTYSPPNATPKFEYLSNYQDLLRLEFKTLDLDKNKTETTGNLFALEFKTDVNETTSVASVLSPGFRDIGKLRFGNKMVIVGADDADFWYAIKNTLLFSMLIVPASVIPAMLIAIILNSKLPGVKFFRSLYFLPSVAAVVGVGVIWREALYSSTVGYINYVISGVIDFLNATFGVSIQDPNVSWLTEASLISIVIMAAWQIVGFNTVLYLAGLQGIPKDLYEAAQVDGADKLRQFFHITLPLLAPTTFFVVVTTLINGLQVFNEPYVLYRDPPPDPKHQLTGVWYLYQRTFLGSDYGYAAAVAWMLFIVIFAITIVQFRFQRRNPYA